MTDGFMWCVAMVSLVGTVANVYRRRWCFVLWACSNVAWVVYDIQKHAHPQAALMAVYAALAVWGWRQWKEARP